jgi:biopolymer transport protein ExbD
MIVLEKPLSQLNLFRNVWLVCLGLMLLAAGATTVRADEEKQPAENEPRTSENDAELKEDLKKLQGTWELYHGNELKGPPNTRSVKIIEGNTETMQRYNLQGNMVREWQVEFILQKDGDLKVFTFYPVGGKPGQGASFLYRIQGDRFYDVPGMFTGEKYRNYLREPAFWIWHRVKEEDADKEKQAVLPPPLLNIISVMPGDHIFVGHRHNNKYRHMTLDGLKTHLEKYQPKQVTLAVDQKADTEFTKQVTELCKSSGVEKLEVKNSSDDPVLKAKAKPEA